MNRVQADIEEVIQQKELFQCLEGKTVLVTGATGFIGSMLIKTFHAANEYYGLGLKVIGQIRNRNKAEELFREIVSDIDLTEDYHVVCDYIVHTVSPTASKYFVEYPVETIKASVNSTISVLETAKKNHATMVYLSSMEEYGVPYQPGQIMTEDQIGIIDHLNVRSSYSESKRLCECLCASYASEYGVSVVIARLAQTVGAGAPLSDNRMPMQFARAVLEEKDIVLHTEGKSVSNFVYVTDAITGILTILFKGRAGQAYNICNDCETRTVWNIANLVANEIARGRISVRVKIPIGNMGYAPDNTMRLNSDRLRALGWKAQVDLCKAYGYLVDYLSEEGKKQCLA